MFPGGSTEAPEGAMAAGTEQEAKSSLLSHTEDAENANQKWGGAMSTQSPTPVICFP